MHGASTVNEETAKKQISIADSTIENTEDHTGLAKITNPKQHIRGYLCAAAQQKYMVDIFTWLPTEGALPHRCDEGAPSLFLLRCRVASWRARLCSGSSRLLRWDRRPVPWGSMACVLHHGISSADNVNKHGFSSGSVFSMAKHRRRAILFFLY